MQAHVKDASMHKKKGWLMKCAKDSGKNWRKRYFILTNNTLNYYVNDKDLRKPKGNVLVVSDAKVRAENAISTKNVGDGNNKKFFGFRLTTPFESILFLSVSETDRALWVRAIQEAIDRAHQSLRGYMLKRTSAMGMERTTRKFWVLHKDTLTFHKDHENTKIDEFAYTITDHTEIDPDDDKWKIKINDENGKRVVTIQFEDRTHDQYPLWRDALLDIRDRHELEEKQYQEHIDQVMSEAVETGEMEVLGDDGTWHSSTVAFTENEVVIQETDAEGKAHAAFFALTPSSKIKRLDEEEVGKPFTFQLTTATETIQLTAKSEEQIQEWCDAIEKIIPYPIAADSEAVLLRAANKKIFEEDELYTVTIEEKKALGMVFQPAEEWALIKQYDGYDSSVTGVKAGSCLTEINGQSVIFMDFVSTTQLLKASFEAPEPLVLEFRRAPEKSGYLNKKSASKKNGKCKWTNRRFDLVAGKLTIFPIEGEGDQTITIPLKGANVNLVSYSEYLQENCFRLEIGAVHMVLQAQDLEDMLDWAATLKHAIAIASGGGHILDKLEENRVIQQQFEESLATFSTEISEEAQNCIIDVGTAFTNKDASALELALTAAYTNTEVMENAEFLECATATLNTLFEEQHGAVNDLQALATVSQPDAEQARIIEEQAEMAAMEEAMDGGEGDSDDEDGNYTQSAAAVRQSSFLPPDILSKEEEDRIAAEESAAEYKSLQELQKAEEPDPEEIGVCATEQDLINVFGFYKKKNEDGGEDFINVMNFCTIWRMITGNKGNLMLEMQIFNSFDKDKNGFLEEDDFTSGFLNHAIAENTNKLLIKLHTLVDGGSVMF
jgi:hypothetical protein